jgi:hypothetical protein
MAGRDQPVIGKRVFRHQCLFEISSLGCTWFTYDLAVLLSDLARNTVLGFILIPFICSSPLSSSQLVFWSGCAISSSYSYWSCDTLVLFAASCIACVALLYLPSGCREESLIGFVPLVD